MSRRDDDIFSGFGAAFDLFGTGGAPRRPVRPAAPAWESKHVTVERQAEKPSAPAADSALIGRLREALGTAQYALMTGARGDVEEALAVIDEAIAASQRAPVAHSRPKPTAPVPEETAETGELKKRVAELEAANAELAAERDQRTESAARLQADFDNFRKRTERERADASQRAAERLVGELLPVLDNLERALDAAEQHEEAALVDGVRLVQRSLVDTLAREGVEEIVAEGVFDPHSQEALMSQPSELPEGEIVQVLQKGYRLAERVVRPARVIVSAGSLTPVGPDADTKDETDSEA